MFAITNNFAEPNRMKPTERKKTKKNGRITQKKNDKKQMEKSYI